jgi:hypothetical protein
MKPFSLDPVLRQFGWRLSLAAAAASLLVACNRGEHDEADPSPPVRSATAGPSVGSSAGLPVASPDESLSTSPMVSPVGAPIGSRVALPDDSPTEQRLADSFANIWNLIVQTRDSDKSLYEWSRSDGGVDPASVKSALRFKQAMRILVGEQAKTAAFAPSYASRYELVVEVLERQQPEFGKKWRDKTFDPVLLHYGFGPLIGKFNSGPLPDDEGPLTDGSMTVDEANKTIVEFCLRMNREYLEPGLKTIHLQQEIGQHAGPEADRCLKETFHVTPEEWLAGRGPADLDLPAAVRKVLVRYHPEIAAPMADFFAGRFSQGVGYFQSDIKRKLAKIATAEQAFVERMLGNDSGYWTADLSGLHRFTTGGTPVNLIDVNLARLDARPANLDSEAALPAPEANDNDLPTFGLAAVRGADGAALETHHYAFCAWPLGYGRIGRQTYLLVDPGKIFVKDTGGKPLDRLPADLDADGWTSIDFHGAVAAPAPASGLTDPDATVRIKALNRLMGVENENDAIPSDPAARQISPAAAKALATTLGDSDHFVRHRACQVTRFFGKPAVVEAKPVLLRCLSSEDAAMRSDTLLAVTELKIRSDEVAAILARLASASDPVERDYAFGALALQQLPDETAQRLIAQAGKGIEAENAGDVYGAIRFLGSRGPLAKDFAATLKRIGITPDPEGGPYPQEVAAEAYFHISSDATVYAAYLVGRLRSQGFDRELMYKLAAVGPPAADALPDLRKLASGPTYDLDKALIAYPIGRISGDLNATVATLIPMLKDPGQTYDALDVLEKLGPDARDALDALQQQAVGKTDGEKEHFERTIAAVKGQLREDDE